MIKFPQEKRILFGPSPKVINHILEFSLTYKKKKPKS